MIISEAALEIITEESLKSCNTKTTLLLPSRVCLSNHTQSTVSSLIPFVPHPDFLCRAPPVSVERAKWNLLALSRSAYGALFLHAPAPPVFSSLARRTTNDLSSLAADYSARYHWHSVLLPLLSAFFLAKDKDVRLVKLVVAVYEFLRRGYRTN